MFTSAGDVLPDSFPAGPAAAGSQRLEWQVGLLGAPGPWHLGAVLSRIELHVPLRS